MTTALNVLVLMCDQLRFDALGCTGNALVHTPYLDRLSTQSVRFDRCYTQSPSCGPARHSLATGCYPHTHGMITSGHTPNSGISQLAHALGPLGYRRINIGRSHWDDPFIATGFDTSVDSRVWMDEMPDAVRERYEWEWHDVTRRTTGGPSTRTMEQNRGQFVARHAIAQIEEAVNNDEPFFCWVDVTEPHPPFYPPREFYEAIDQKEIRLPEQPETGTEPHESIVARRSEWSHLTEVDLRQTIAAYYGMVSLADEFCGRVLDALDRLGVREDTVVVWTVDHGDQMWDHQLFLKGCMYEGSVHVPLLVSVPGAAAGQRSELVEHIDLFPTICDLVGAQTPQSVQGRSLLPLLGRGPAPPDWRRAVFAQLDDLQMIRTEDWKLNLYGERPGELYDLKNDPGEFRNLVAAGEHEQTLEELHSRLREWERSNGPAGPSSSAS